MYDKMKCVGRTCVQLSGAGILTVGLWTFFDKQWLAGILSSRDDFAYLFLVLMYSLIAIGVFVILITFTVGCCATVSRSRPCLMLVRTTHMLSRHFYTDTATWGWWGQKRTSCRYWRRIFTVIECIDTVSWQGSHASGKVLDFYGHPME